MATPAEQVKEKLNIMDVVGGYVKLQKAGKNLRASCPFHKERTPSFYVSPERGTYYCFGCGEKGDIFTFVERMEGLDFVGALRMLAERAGVKITQNASPERREEKNRLFSALAEATVFFGEELTKRDDVTGYLRTRGLTDETMRAWNLGYAPPQWRTLAEYLREKGFMYTEMVKAGLSIETKAKDGTTTFYDRFRGRVMFPMRDSAGRVIGFSGRFFERVEGSKEEGDPAKYVNSPETSLFKKSQVLYGLDRAKQHIRKADFSVLVEGQMDLLMSHQSGFPNTVALSGTALTEIHLKNLSYLSKRLVLALDSDAAGLRSTTKSALLALGLGFDLKVAAFPAGFDPADQAKKSVEEFRGIIRNSKSVVDFLLEELRRGAKDERAYRKAVETEVLPLIAAMGSAIDRAHFAERVGRALGLPTESVLEEVRQTAGRRGIKDEEPLPEREEARSRFERSVGLLLALSPGEDDPVRSRLKELLGSRYEGLREILEKESDRLLFEAEAAGTPIGVVGELLATVELELLLQRIAKATEAVRKAEEGGDTKEAGELMKELHGLVKERENLKR